MINLKNTAASALSVLPLFVFCSALSISSAFASDDSAGGVCAPLVRGCGEAGGKVEYDSFSFDASSPLFFGRVEIKPVKKAQSVKGQPKFDATAWIKRILEKNIRKGGGFSAVNIEGTIETFDDRFSISAGAKLDGTESPASSSNVDFPLCGDVTGALYEIVNDAFKAFGRARMQRDEKFEVDFYYMSRIDRALALLAKILELKPDDDGKASAEKSKAGFDATAAALALELAALDELNPKAASLWLNDKAFEPLFGDKIKTVPSVAALAFWIKGDFDSAIFYGDKALTAAEKNAGKKFKCPEGEEFACAASEGVFAAYYETLLCALADSTHKTNKTPQHDAYFKKLIKAFPESACGAYDYAVRLYPVGKKKEAASTLLFAMEKGSYNMRTINLMFDKGLIIADSKKDLTAKRFRKMGNPCLANDIEADKFLQNPDERQLDRIDGRILSFDYRLKVYKKLREKGMEPPDFWKTAYMGPGEKEPKKTGGDGGFMDVVSMMLAAAIKSDSVKNVSLIYFPNPDVKSLSDYDAFSAVLKERFKGAYLFDAHSEQTINQCLGGCRWKPRNNGYEFIQRLFEHGHDGIMPEAVITLSSGDLSPPDPKREGADRTLNVSMEVFLKGSGAKGFLFDATAKIKADDAVSSAGKFFSPLAIALIASALLLFLAAVYLFKRSKSHKKEPK